MSENIGVLIAFLTGIVLIGMAGVGGYHVISVIWQLVHAAALTAWGR
jgi:hypothetical protein